MQTLEQLGRGLKNAPQLFAQLVSHAGLDQDFLFAGVYQHRIQSGGEKILRVGRHALLPQHFGNNAEEDAAIHQIRPVAQQRQLKLAELELLAHFGESSTRTKCFWTRVNKSVCSTGPLMPWVLRG